MCVVGAHEDLKILSLQEVEVELAKRAQKRVKLGRSQEMHGEPEKTVNI